MISGNIYGK